MIAFNITSIVLEIMNHSLACFLDLILCQASAGLECSQQNCPSYSSLNTEDLLNSKFVPAQFPTWYLLRHLDSCFPSEMDAPDFASSIILSKYFVPL